MAEESTGIVYKIEELLEALRAEIVELKVSSAISIERTETLSRRCDEISTKVNDMHKHMMGITSKISSSKKASNGWVAQVMMLVIASLIGGFTTMVFAKVSEPSQTAISAPVNSSQVSP